MRSLLQNDPHTHEYGQWDRGPEYVQTNTGKFPLGYTIVHATQMRSCIVCGANQIREA